MSAITHRAVRSVAVAMRRTAARAATLHASRGFAGASVHAAGFGSRGYSSSSSGQSAPTATANHYGFRIPWILAGIVTYFAHEHFAGAAESVEQRQLEAIKARILDPERPSLPLTRLLHRPAAAAALAESAAANPITAIVAPPGTGKSTVARAYARDPANRHAIYVDLYGCTDYDAAARRVADAIGCPTKHTRAENTARRFHYPMKHLDEPMGPAEYRAMLTLFVRACRELWAEGKLPAEHVPVLLLDHVSRPFGARPPVDLDTPPPAPPASASSTLVHDTLESAMSVGDGAPMRVVLVAGDTAPGRATWHAAGARDGVRFSDLPGMTREEACQMLAQLAYFQLHPAADKSKEPSAKELHDIQHRYAATFAFLVDILGASPRALAAAMAAGGTALVPDSDLAAKGAPVPGAILPLLTELRGKPSSPIESEASLPAGTDAPSGSSHASSTGVLVDPHVLRHVTTWINEQQRAVEQLVALPLGHAIDSSSRTGQRAFGVVTGLRALLAAGTLPVADFEAALGSNKHLAPLLTEQQLIFYNEATKQVAFANEAVKLVVWRVLSSRPEALHQQVARPTGTME